MLDEWEICMIDEQTFLLIGTDSRSAEPVTGATAGYAERHPEDLFGAAPR